MIRPGPVSIRQKLESSDFFSILRIVSYEHRFVDVFVERCFADVFGSKRRHMLDSDSLRTIICFIYRLMSRKGQVNGLAEGIGLVYSFPDWNRTTNVPKSVPRG